MSSQGRFRRYRRRGLGKLLGKYLKPRIIKPYGIKVKPKGGGGLKPGPKVFQRHHGSYESSKEKLINLPKVQYPSPTRKPIFSEPHAEHRPRDKILWDPEARKILKDIEKVLSEEKTESLDKLDVDKLAELLEKTNDLGILERLSEKQLEEINDIEMKLENLESEAPQNVVEVNPESKSEQDVAESHGVSEPSLEATRPTEHDYETYQESEVDVLKDYLDDVESPGAEKSVDMPELGLDQMENTEPIIEPIEHEFDIPELFQELENELVEPELAEDMEAEVSEGY